MVNNENSHFYALKFERPCLRKSGAFEKSTLFIKNSQQAESQNGTACTAKFHGKAHGTAATVEARRYRVDGYPKRYIVLDPFYSSRSVPNDLT